MKRETALEAAEKEVMTEKRGNLGRNTHTLKQAQSSLSVQRDRKQKAAEMMEKSNISTRRKIENKKEKAGTPFRNAGRKIHDAHSTEVRRRQDQAGKEREKNNH